MLYICTNICLRSRQESWHLVRISFSTFSFAATELEGYAVERSDSCFQTYTPADHSRDFSLTWLKCTFVKSFDLLFKGYSAVDSQSSSVIFIEYPESLGSLTHALDSWLEHHGHVGEAQWPVMDTHRRFFLSAFSRANVNATVHVQRARESHNQSVLYKYSFHNWTKRSGM